MFFSLSQQTVYFLASLALGAALAVLYDLVRALRMLLRASRVHIIVSDILFFFICGVLTSLFALPFNKGDVRGFTVFGEAVGFLAYRLTLGSIFGKIYAVIARLLRRFIRKICEKLKKIYDFLLKAGALLLYNIGVVIERFCRTAFSGVRVLTGEIRAARKNRRRAKQAHDSAESAVIRVSVTAGRPIERHIITGTENGKKRFETRKKSKKARTGSRNA